MHRATRTRHSFAEDTPNAVVSEGDFENWDAT